MFKVFLEVKNVDLRENKPTGDKTNGGTYHGKQRMTYVFEDNCKQKEYAHMAWPGYNLSR